jgi:hypothetical protein
MSWSANTKLVASFQTRRRKPPTTNLIRLSLTATQRQSLADWQSMGLCNVRVAGQTVRYRGQQRREKRQLAYAFAFLVVVRWPSQITVFPAHVP